LACVTNVFAHWLRKWEISSLLAIEERNRKPRYRFLRT